MSISKNSYKQFHRVIHMVNFEDFLSDLKSDERWFEYSSMHYKPETFEKAARQVYAQCLADQLIKPISECRKHVYNILAKIPGDKVKTDWIGKAAKEIKRKEEEKKAAEWVPLTGEARAKKLQEWLDKVRAVEMQSAVPRVTHKEAVEQGGWLPKKDAVYPVTSVEEAYIKDRHLAYITYAYEPRTAVRMPGVMDEEQFNLEYDEMMLNKLGK